MRARWIITLAVVCFATIMAGALLIGQYCFEIIGTQIVQQLEHSRTRYTPPEPVSFTKTNVTVYHQDNPIFQGPDKPLIITSGLTAQDMRSNYSSRLQVTGRLNNTGGGTAYNAYLHVVAMNNEGTAIDTSYSFAGITPHMSLGLNFELTYNGTKIDNCTITPIYSDKMQPAPPFNGSLPHA